jgi:hypothetical protein
MKITQIWKIHDSYTIFIFVAKSPPNCCIEKEAITWRPTKRIIHKPVRR